VSLTRLRDLGQQAAIGTPPDTDAADAAGGPIQDSAIRRAIIGALRDALVADVLAEIGAADESRGGLDHAGPLADVASQRRPS
jgi:hypothetical protein